MSKPSEEKQWEQVAGLDLESGFTARLEVPGGWLYRHIQPDLHDETISPSVFVLFVPRAEGKHTAGTRR